MLWSRLFTISLPPLKEKVHESWMSEFRGLEQE
jgi:hypothetical protein